MCHPGALLKTYVVDSAVLTDFEVAGFLPEAGLPMPFQLVVADLIEAYGESDKHDTQELADLGFVVESLAGHELDHAIRLGQEHVELSLHDVVALTLCLEREYDLLARGPQLLAAARDRRVVGDRQVVVRSTLWLLDQLATHARLAPWEAARAVRTMKDRGRGLDSGECERFIAKWDRPER